MLRNNIVIFTLIIFFLSCGMNDNSAEYRTNYRRIYNGLKKDNDFSKFIGFHIVRRGNNQFFYKNLKADSSINIPVVYDGGNPKLATKLFFEQNINSRMQLDKMNEFGIKAVITTNYDSIEQRIEYPRKGGCAFNNYQLMFTLSDSIEIVNINYYRLIKNHYSVVEKLDSNWLVLKRL